MLGQVTTSALSGDAFESNSAPCDDAAALDEDEYQTRRKHVNRRESEAPENMTNA